MFPTTQNEIINSGVGPVRQESSVGLYLQPGGASPAMPVGTVAVDPSTLQRSVYDSSPTTTTAADSGAYNAYLSSLSQQRALLDQQRLENEALVGSNYNVQKGALDTSLRQGNENLNRQMSTAERNKAMSLRDLGSSVRSAYKAGINKLGTQGAADSSAAKMYGVALGAEEGKGRAGVTDDFQYNVQGIELARRQAQERFNDQMAQLDVWKQGELSKIVQQYQTQASYLDGQMASATPQQTAAITQAKQAAAQQAVSGIQGVQATYQATTNDIANATAADQRGYSAGPNWSGAINALGNVAGNFGQSIYGNIFKRREQ